MNTILFIVIMAAGTVQTDKIEFRSVATCEAAASDMARELVHLYTNDSGVRITLSCVDRSEK